MSETVTEIIRREREWGGRENESDRGGMRVKTASIAMAQLNNTRTFCFYSYAGHALSSTMAFLGWEKNIPADPSFLTAFQYAPRTTSISTNTISSLSTKC